MSNTTNRMDRRDFYGMVAIVLVTNFVVSIYVWSLIDPIYETLANTEEIGRIALKQNNETIKLQQQGNAQTDQMVNNMSALALGIVTYINQSNVVGNASVALILETIDANRKLILEDLESERNNTTAHTGNVAEIRSIALLTSEPTEGNDTGQISSFFGGPMLTNETIPLELKATMKNDTALNLDMNMTLPKPYT